MQGTGTAVWALGRGEKFSYGGCCTDVPGLSCWIMIKPNKRVVACCGCVTEVSAYYTPNIMIYTGTKMIYLLFKALMRFASQLADLKVIFNGFHVGSVRHITPFTIT